MSVPTIARAAKAEKRVNEAYDAAANGEISIGPVVCGIAEFQNRMDRRAGK